MGSNPITSTSVISRDPDTSILTMADDHEGGSFRGDRFTGTDFSGSTWRDCDLRGVKVVDSWLTDVAVSGLVERFVVNDVDVAPYVEGELDRRHPERVQVREMRTADDNRAAWDTVERLWADTLDRARHLPEPARQQRVDDEWSLVETLRHLVFVVDAWASRTVLDEPRPYHPLGYPHSSHPPADAADIGLDLGATPGFDEVVEVHLDRLAVVRGIVDGLTDAELERACTRTPAPGYPDVPHTVGHCLHTVIREHCEHRRFAVRDLAVLEAQG